MAEKKILIIEPAKDKYQHAKVNAGIINILSRISSKITLVCTRSHRSSLHDEGMNTIGKIKYLPIITHSGSGILSFVLMSFLSSMNIFFTCLFAKVNRFDFVFILSAPVISNFVVKILSQAIKLQCVLVLHGELEFLVRNHKTSKLTNFCLKKFNNSLTKYLVLLPHIKDGLHQYVPELPEQLVHSLIHPTPLTIAKSSRLMSSNCKKIGIIGRVDETKNGKELISLILSLDQLVLQNLCEIEFVGYLAPSLIPQTSNRIVFENHATEEISASDYRKKLQDIDFAIFAYEGNSYQMTASGAVFDALVAGIPILALKHKLFDELEGIFGQIGYFFNTFTELENAIRDILRDSGEFDLDRVRTNLINLPSRLYEINRFQLSNSIFNG